MKGAYLKVFVLILSFSNQLNAQPTPIIYFPLDSNTNDYSGNNQHAINHGATSTTDRKGNPNSAYFFDGNDYLEFPTQILDCNRYTISMWVKVDYTATNITQKKYMFSIGDNTEGIEFTQYPKNFPANMKLGIYMRLSSGGGTGYSDEISYNQTGWYQYTVVIDSAAKTMFSYGKGSGKAYLAGPSNLFILKNKNGRIGCYFDNSSKFKGAIDDVRIYCDTLSKEQIAQMDCNIKAPNKLTDTICPGNSTVFDVLNDANTYTWYNKNNLNAPILVNSSFTTPVLYQTDTFYVKSSSASCTSDLIPQIVVVKENGVNIVSSPNDTSSCAEDSISMNLSALGTISSYTWEIKEGNFYVPLENSNKVIIKENTLQLNPVADFMNKSIRVIVMGECSVPDTSENFQINLKELCDTWPIDTISEDTTVMDTTVNAREPIFNTIVTPNNDGINDAFTISHLENSPNHNLQIFNRWGRELLNVRDYKNDWPKSENNIISGTYFFIFIDEKQKISNGFITIIK